MHHHKNCPHHPPGNLSGQNLITASIVSNFKKIQKKIYSAIPEKIRNVFHIAGKSFTRISGDFEENPARFMVIS